MQREIVKCIIFSIITCGIYELYWLVKINNEMKEMTGDTSLPDGVMVLILDIVTCGIYGIYWCYKMGQKVDTINGGQGNNAVLFLVLALVGNGLGQLVTLAILQDTINKNVA